MRINPDLKKLGAHGGPGYFFSQLARQCYMGNSCKHDHEEEIKEDIICYTRRRGRYLPKYILERVSDISNDLFIS